MNYNAFWDGAWETQPSPNSKPVSQYTEGDKRKISYMLLLWRCKLRQAGYLALYILGQLDPVNSETDRIVMQWIKQYREPVNTTWNNALMSAGASDIVVGGVMVRNLLSWMWPYLGLVIHEVRQNRY